MTTGGSPVADPDLPRDRRGREPVVAGDDDDPDPGAVAASTAPRHLGRGGSTIATSPSSVRSRSASSRSSGQRASGRCATASTRRPAPAAKLRTAASTPAGRVPDVAAASSALFGGALRVEHQAVGGLSAVDIAAGRGVEVEHPPRFALRVGVHRHADPGGAQQQRHFGGIAGRFARRT